MYKLVVIVTAMAVSTVLSYPAAQPNANAGILAAAPFIAAPAVVAAQSSQVVARNYNAFAAPIVAAPAVAPVAAPLITSPYISSYAAAPYISPYLPSPYLGATGLL